MMRIGHSRDRHPLKEGKPLRLGGIDIESEAGAVAHSDGDCLLHALTESMLGALALGDLGSHFPDTDARYEGADSAELLKIVAGWLKTRGYTIVNIDTTVFLERPKLAAYVPRIRACIAELLEVDKDCISVKATRGEGLGSIGRGEAVEAECVVLVQKRSGVAYL